MTTKQLYCITQGKHFSGVNVQLHFLQPFLVGNSTSLVMNTPTKRHGNRDSCNVKHDYYQNMHWWHPFGINTNGSYRKSSSFYVWKVNLKHRVFHIKSFIHSGEQNKRFYKINCKFPIYIQTCINYSAFYYQISFFKKNSIKVILNNL